MTTVALMQPYFFPYAGYFRLFVEADHFIIYDCVQIPNRGRVNRTPVPGPSGAPEWLTLPLANHPHDAFIQDCAFASDARARVNKRLARHVWLREARGTTADRVRSYLYSPFGSLVDFLEEGLRLVADELDLHPTITRCSALSIDTSLRGEPGVIAIVKAAGGTRYINSPGGRALYRSEAFAEEGIALSFLPPYEGPYKYMLHSLMTEPIAAIADDVRSGSAP